MVCPRLTPADTFEVFEGECLEDHLVILFVPWVSVMPAESIAVCQVVSYLVQDRVRQIEAVRIDKYLDSGFRGRDVDQSAPAGEQDESDGTDGPQAQLARFASGAQIIQRDESGTSLSGQDHRLQLAPMQSADGSPDEGSAEF